MTVLYPLCPVSILLCWVELMHWSYLSRPCQAIGCQPCHSVASFEGSRLPSGCRTFGIKPRREWLTSTLRLPTWSVFVQEFLQCDVVHALGEDQLGFRKGKDTREAITILRNLGKRSMQHGKDMYICFVDYEEAFDRVNWRSLMRALERIAIDWKDRRLIKNLYMGQTVMIRIDGINSKPGKIGRAVRQRCPLSPLLFNIYIEEIVRERMEKLTDGFFKRKFLDNKQQFAIKMASTCNLTKQA